MRKKVTIVGAGNVGASAAQRLAELDLCDVVLVDVMGDVAKGKALDMNQVGSIIGYHTRLFGGKEYEPMKGSDVVVVTAGFPRQPGMSRDDLLVKNAEIVRDVAKNIKKYAPKSIVIVVTNPLDAMVELVRVVTGFSPNKVMGQAGILDTARYKFFIAEKLGVSVKDVHGVVLGGHGDTMVPVPQYTSVAGIPLATLMSQKDIDAIVDRTRNGGGEIVQLLGKGSAYYAPAAATVDMVEALLRDSKRVLPVSAYVKGQYGFKDIYIGVPCVLGSEGVERILEVDLGAGKSLMEQSAKAVQGNKEALKRLKLI